MMWRNLPTWVADAFRDHARSVLATYPRYLPERGLVAGFETETFDAVWVELLARGLHLTFAAVKGLEDPHIVAPRIDRTRFVESVTQAIDRTTDEVMRIVDFLSLDLERWNDPALTPLVPLDDDLVPMSVSIVHTSPHRNLLSILQRDPNLVGEAGRLLGLVGESKTIEVLKRLKPDTLIARRVKVWRPDGSVAGDLDVVACDPSAKLVVAIEVRWGIAADGNEEVHRVEEGAPYRL